MTETDKEPIRYAAYTCSKNEVLCPCCRNLLWVGALTTNYDAGYRQGLEDALKQIKWKQENESN